MRATSILEAKTSEFLQQNLSFQNAHAYICLRWHLIEPSGYFGQTYNFLQTVVIHFDGLENSLLCMYKAPICKLLLINKPQITFWWISQAMGSKKCYHHMWEHDKWLFWGGNKTAPIAGFELGIPDITSLPPNQLSRSCYNPERGDSDHLDWFLH